METKNESKENITAKPDRNEVEGADTGCYRPVNHLHISHGEWGYQEESDAYTHIVRVDKRMLLCHLSQDHTGESEANARLISAAPEMYEAIYEVLNQKHELDNYVMELCRNALKKAGG